MSWIISDQNGETYRANEWGHALARLRGDWPAMESPDVWLPAISFGDTGAASSLVAVCMAVQAFDRRYGPAGTAVVIASSESGARAALTLHAPIRRGGP